MHSVERNICQNYNPDMWILKFEYTSERKIDTILNKQHILQLQQNVAIENDCIWK